MIVKVPTPTRSVYSNRIDGAFGVLKPNFIWYSCRDMFHSNHSRYKNKDFLFLVGNKKIQVKKFIKIVQNKLKIPVSSRLVIKKTDKKDVICISPGAWWSVPIRLSLLTILLRCGCVYESNFEYALYNSNYIRSTRRAFDLFMNGKTNYIGETKMWVKAFGYNVKSENIKFMLLDEEDVKVSEKSITIAESIIKKNGKNIKLKIAKALDMAVKEGYTAGKGEQ